MEIDEKGPVLDRQWMLVDENNSFLTMRQRPDLTLFRVSLGNFVELTWKDGDMMDFGLSEVEGESMKVKIWKDEVKAHEVSGEVSEWLSSKLDQKVKLVRMDDDARRAFSEDDPDSSTRFTDSSPVLVLSKASLELLDMKIGKKVATSRFRPNLVVDHLEAHQEDLIEGFYIGRVEFHFLKKASRCRVIQVNPLTGELTDEPMKTLSEYRKEDGKVFFGSYYSTKGMGTV
tara:strand:- start:5613 stop:6302 length:690 start_codon:yes stop_codon:yes gene_type:complete